MEESELGLGEVVWEKRLQRGWDGPVWAADV